MYERYSYKKIATFLNEKGIPSSTCRLWSYPKDKENKLVLNNLKNEIDLTETRIELLKKDANKVGNSSTYMSYIEELTRKLNELNNTQKSIKMLSSNLFHLFFIILISNP